MVLVCLPLLAQNVLSQVSNTTCTDSRNLQVNTTLSIDVDGTVKTVIISKSVYCQFGCNSVKNECVSDPYASSSNNFTDVLALIFFLGNIAIMFAKMYNLAKLGEAYDRVWIFILMIFSFLSWLIMLVFLSFRPGLDTVFYFQLTSYIMLINFFLMILEVLMLWTTLFTKKETQGPLLRKPGSRPSIF